jgi:hypothetical protein
MILGGITDSKVEKKKGASRSAFLIQISLGFLSRQIRMGMMM